MNEQSQRVFVFGPKITLSIIILIETNNRSVANKKGRLNINQPYSTELLLFHYSSDEKSPANDLSKSSSVGAISASSST